MKDCDYKLFFPAAAGPESQKRAMDTYLEENILPPHKHSDNFEVLAVSHILKRPVWVFQHRPDGTFARTVVLGDFENDNAPVCFLRHMQGHAEELTHYGFANAMTDSNRSANVKALEFYNKEKRHGYKPVVIVVDGIHYFVWPTFGDGNCFLRSWHLAAYTLSLDWLMLYSGSGEMSLDTPPAAHIHRVTALWLNACPVKPDSLFDNQLTLQTLFKISLILQVQVGIQR
jgi:hypothetical protein